jgi:nicotinate-nucleotide adenylyltransferase
MNNRFVLPASVMSNPKRVNQDIEKKPLVEPLAVYFGTFNPVHFGHLQIAQAVIHQGYAQQVAFVPTGNPPNRISDPSLVAGHHRFEMLKRATSPYETFTVWPDEVDFPIQSEGEHAHPIHYKIHYTYDTLEKRFRLSQQTQPLNLPFILGEDSFNTLKHWKNIEQLLVHCHFLLIRRGIQEGEPNKTLQTLPSCRYTLLNLPLLPHSATEIRQQFASGKVPYFLTPDAVIEYSQWNHLY